MRKLILFFSLVLLLSCSSSSDDKPDTQPNNSNNFVELNNQKYYFDNGSITKKESGNSVLFTIYLSDTPLTNHLYFVIRYSKNDSTGASYYYDLGATYSYNNNSSAKMSSFALVQYSSDGVRNTVSNESDFIGGASRVVVYKNSEFNYTFNINCVTTLGTINGNYTGDVKKIGF